MTTEQLKNKFKSIWLEIKLIIKKYWDTQRWNIRKKITGKLDNAFRILDLRGNEQVDTLDEHLKTEQFSNLIVSNGLVSVRWLDTYYILEETFDELEGKWEWTAGYELSKSRAILLGIYHRLDNKLIKSAK